MNKKILSECFNKYAKLNTLLPAMKKRRREGRKEGKRKKEGNRRREEGKEVFY